MVKTSVNNTLFSLIQYLLQKQYNIPNLITTVYENNHCDIVTS
jgi:hypothetical protein